VDQNVPGSGTGWSHETPLSPPPGLRYVDQQIDAQDMRDRKELIEKKAKEQALLKAAKSKRLSNDTDRYRAYVRAYMKRRRSKCTPALSKAVTEPR
jgi:hypothetical protein